MSYFNERLKDDPLGKTPAAALLRTGIITRDDSGDFYLIFKYPYHAAKIMNAENMKVTALIFQKVYFIDRPTNIYVCVIGAAVNNVETLVNR